MSSLMMLPSKSDKIQLISKERKDCAFICGEDRIGAHKLVLSYASPVFEKMFFGEMKASEIVLLDINFSDLKQVIDYIYTEIIKISSIQNAWALIYVSQKYFLKDLLDICICYVIDNLSVDNLLLCYEYSQLYNIKMLMESCWKNIQKYFKGLIHVNYHMQLNTLHSILLDSKLLGTDSDLIILMFKWAIDECELNEIEPIEENLLLTLKENKLIKDFSSFDKFDYKLSETLKQIDSYSNLNDIINIIVNLNNQIESRFIKYNRKIFPQTYQFRLLYKISRGHFFSNAIQIASDVTTSRTIYLFGLAISSLHQPAGVDNLSYDSTIDVRITHNMLTYYNCRFKQNNIIYNDVQRLVFPVAIKLESKKSYTIIVTYYNENINAKGQVVLNYCSDALVNKRNSTVITFSNELDGSILQGLSYLIA
ncbi:kelch-like protein 41a [Onthophagus taurus]|uniref:kelch-like protein 41a n=1 Tax=Onthophagus taurus TaxID=166361 RepID=UPI0039BE20B9